LLYDLPNVVITPHIAGSLGTETRRMSDVAISELGRYLSGKGLTAEVLPQHLDLIA
jgi:phosphoglycerate dehydrogenase-like enzyme